MGDVKIVLDYAGVGELLRSEEMKAVCEEEANKALSRLGAGYEVTTFTGPSRMNASIKAVTQQAKRDVQENNTLIKALG